MGKIRNYIKYTLAELENYTKAKAVKKINSKIHFNLPPHGLSDIKRAILQAISDKKIGEYDCTLQGIILDIRNIKIVGTTANIRYDDPNLHLDIIGDCYIFQPVCGSIVRGTVKYISTEHIGVIIYRVFSVIIKLQERIDKSIRQNSEIEFRIKNFDLRADVPFIEGQLIAQEIYNSKSADRSQHIVEIDISDTDSENMSSVKFEDKMDSIGTELDGQEDNSNTTIRGRRESTAFKDKSQFSCSEQDDFNRNKTFSRKSQKSKRYSDLNMSLNKLLNRVKLEKLPQEAGNTTDGDQVYGTKQNSQYNEMTQLTTNSSINDSEKSKSKEKGVYSKQTPERKRKKGIEPMKGLNYKLFELLEKSKKKQGSVKERIVEAESTNNTLHTYENTSVGNNIEEEGSHKEKKTEIENKDKRNNIKDLFKDAHARTEKQSFEEISNRSGGNKSASKYKINDTNIFPKIKVEKLEVDQEIKPRKRKSSLQNSCEIAAKKTTFHKRDKSINSSLDFSIDSIVDKSLQSPQLSSTRINEKF